MNLASFAPSDREKATYMLVPEALRVLIRAKLADGRLPQNSIHRVWGGPGNGEVCIACDEVVTKANIVMEGIGEGTRAIQFHVRCFYVWDSERDVPGR